MRLVFVHGRSQQGKDPVALREEWIDAFNRGLAKNGLSLPADIDIRLPFYGDRLHGFTQEAGVPLTEDLRTKGGAPQTDFLAFEAEMLEELRQSAGITDAQIDTAFDADPDRTEVTEKGPMNWEWVHTIVKLLDTHVTPVSDFTVETFIRDVYLYVSSAGVRDAVDAIVQADIGDGPAVVVSHSLGTVVAYSLLRRLAGAVEVPMFMTLGCPLGIRPIRKRFRPIGYPAGAGSWHNDYDERDIVALYPLDQDNFPVTPAIANSNHVDNHTDNRHGIAGYLDDAAVARAIHDAVA